MAPGQSTTMRMILELDRPTSSTVTAGGRGYPRRKLWHGARVSAPCCIRAPCTPAVRRFTTCTAFAAANGIARARVDAGYPRAGGAGVGGAQAGRRLLAGMFQRLGIAGALLGDPGTLLFDEPVNALDPEGIIWIRTLLRSLAAEGRTVLVSSHLISQMALTPNHLLGIGLGRMIADMPSSELMARHSGDRVAVRSTDLRSRAADLRAAGGQSDAEAGRDARRGQRSCRVRSAQAGR